MSLKKLLVIVVILVTIFLVFLFQEMGEKQMPPCLDKIGCVDLGPEESVTIGVIQDISGSASSFGIDQIRSYEIALSKRNHQLMGHPVRLIIEDSRCSAEYGVLAARKLVNDPKVIAMLGTTCSLSATKVSKIVSEAGYSIISGTNSAASLTSVGGVAGDHWYPGFFRTMFSTDKSGEVAALFVYNILNIQKAAVIHDGDIYTRGYAANFAKKYQTLGGEVVLQTQVNKGESNMIPVLTAVKNSKAELVLLPIFSQEGKNLVKQVKKIPGLQDIKLLGGNALINDKFIQDIGDDGINMYFLSIAPGKKTPQLTELIKAFENRYGEPPHSTLFDFGFDAMKVLLTAIERSTKADQFGNLQIGRQALRQSLYDIREFPGISGKLSTTPFGDLGIPRFNIVRLKDPLKGVAGLKANVVYSTTDMDQLR
jgi:branched-chain amino acid transport system substrate-binding protein